MGSIQEYHKRRVGDQLIEWAIVQVMRDAALHRAQRAHPFLLDDLLLRVRNSLIGFSRSVVRRCNSAVRLSTSRSNPPL
jgi:hypothetical protein